MERPPFLRIHIFKALLKAQLQCLAATCSQHRWMRASGTILAATLLLALGELAAASLEPMKGRGEDGSFTLEDWLHGWFASALLLLVATAAGLCHGTIRQTREIEWLRSLSLLPCEVETALLTGVLPRIAGLAAILLIPAFHAAGVHDSGRLWKVGWALLFLPPTSLLALSIGALLARALRHWRGRCLLVTTLALASMGLAASTLPEPSAPIASSSQPFLRVLHHPALPSAQLARAALGAARRDTPSALRTLALLWAAAFTGTAATLAMAARSSSRSHPNVSEYRAGAIGPESQPTDASRLCHPGLRASLAFARKDWRTFWQDPLQWGHLLWILLLANLQLLAIQHAAPEIVQLIPQRGLPGMVAALCMLTAPPLATRFIYPLPCNERPRMWMIAGAPWGVRAMIRSQFILGCGALFAISAWMQTAACTSLGLEWRAQLPLLLVTCSSSAASTSIALVAAACFPAPFSEDPARMASGLRATVALVAGLAHALGCAVIECLPAVDHPSLASTALPHACHAACIALNLAVTAGLLSIATTQMRRHSTTATG